MQFSLKGLFSLSFFSMLQSPLCPHAVFLSANFLLAFLLNAPHLLAFVSFGISIIVFTGWEGLFTSMKMSSPRILHFPTNKESQVRFSWLKSSILFLPISFRQRKIKAACFTLQEANPDSGRKIWSCRRAIKIQMFPGGAWGQYKRDRAFQRLSLLSWCDSDTSYQHVREVSS